MSSENPRLEKLLEQRGKIENRIKQIHAKETAQKRKIDTRRKILFGVMFEGMLADNRVKEKTINSAIDGYLKNDRDRDLIKNYVASLPKPDPEPQE
jgi:large subunit ribosomal protein L7/L12